MMLLYGGHQRKFNNSLVDEAVSAEQAAEAGPAGDVTDHFNLQQLVIFEDILEETDAFSARELLACWSISEELG